MTASKRPNRLSHWIRGLTAHLEARLPPRAEALSAPLDPFSEALDAWSRIPEGDRKLFAVATCLYKVAYFRDELPKVEQRPSDNSTDFEVIDAKTGKIITDDLKGVGLRELVASSKGRWPTELHISNVLRLHRAGFTNTEIAGLLPNGEHRTTADVRREAKAIAALITKYQDAARQDLGTTPANWPLRVP
jgi:hypothetical protein